MLFACANQKEPAEKAVAQVESSLAEFRADAEKYAAEELKSVEASVAKLKTNLAKKDYQAVKAAPRCASSVKSLKDSVAVKKADMEAVMAAAQAEWTDISAKMPQMVDALQSRIDTLSKSRKLPGGVDKATFESVKTDFEAVKTEWTEASSQFASGMADAAAQGA